jgi:hypothetical protein
MRKRPERADRVRSGVTRQFIDNCEELSSNLVFSCVYLLDIEKRRKWNIKGTGRTKLNRIV